MSVFKEKLLLDIVIAISTTTTNGNDNDYQDESNLLKPKFTDSLKKKVFEIKKILSPRLEANFVYSFERELYCSTNSLEGCTDENETLCSFSSSWSYI